MRNDPGKVIDDSRVVRVLRRKDLPSLWTQSARTMSAFDSLRACACTWGWQRARGVGSVHVELAWCMWIGSVHVDWKRAGGLGSVQVGLAACRWGWKRANGVGTAYSPACVCVSPRSSLSACACVCSFMNEIKIA